MNRNPRNERTTNYSALRNFNMGVCLSKEYVIGQEAINNQLRQETAQALEAVKNFQNVLQETPQSKVELEAMKLIVTHQRELVELKKLAEVRAELDSLKSNLKLDPSFILADVQEEIRKIQEKVVAMKEIKGVASQLSTTHPFASLTSSAQGWGGAMTAGFEITPQGLKVTTPGLYQVYVVFSPFGYSNRTVCSLSHNGQPVARQGQTDGGPTFIYHLLKLEENDVIAADVDATAMNMLVNIAVPGGVHHRVQLNVLLIK